MSAGASPCLNCFDDFVKIVLLMIMVVVVVCFVVFWKEVYCVGDGRNGGRLFWFFVLCLSWPCCVLPQVG